VHGLCPCPEKPSRDNPSRRRLPVQPNTGNGKLSRQCDKIKTARSRRASRVPDTYQANCVNGDSTRSYLLGRPDAWEDYPFGPDVAVFKIRKKMFATLGYEQDIARINLKCDPEQAMALRDIFESVLPGYHMNKAHWNTVILDGSIPAGEIERMIDQSYALVVKGLPRAERSALEIKYGQNTLYR
jgi:predicted DNA-binding protein (MmcQ/YjbR family)